MEKRAMSIAIIVIAVALMLALGLAYYVRPSKTAEQNTPNTQQTQQTTPSAAGTTAAKKIITITSSGFSPATITIQKGQTITFVNQDASPHWPASNVHPTHTSYPGSGIQKCGTSEESTIFDACRGLLNGEELTFTFNEVGTWGYHDHLNAFLGGKITVTP